MGFKVMSRRCDQCLMDAKNRIVSAARASELLRQCAQQNVPFLCHKGTMVGREIACRGHHDAMPSKNARFAEWLGLAHEEFDPVTLQRAPSRSEDGSQARPASDGEARLAAGQQATEPSHPREETP
jgi:hypothetical protein